MDPLQLHEVILYCEDMATQYAFYATTLGLPVKYPTTSFDSAAEYWIEFDTGACTLCLHGGGKREFGVDAPKFVWGVRDIRATKHHLDTIGVKCSEIREPAPGVFVIDAFDPEGNKMSFESRV
jgi:catechol 2,3-dioxygenase-like lactoylglutathione lyase family enzyme